MIANKQRLAHVMHLMHEAASFYDACSTSICPDRKHLS